MKIGSGREVRQRREDGARRCTTRPEWNQPVWQRVVIFGDVAAVDITQGGDGEAVQMGT